MKTVVGWSMTVLGALTPANADAPLPVIDGRKVVATVNGASITLDAFAEALAKAHEGAMESDQEVARQDPAQLLDRLIDVELAVQEAENIGLDESPRVRDAVEAFKKRTRRNLLLGDQAREITVPDANRVEELYRQRIKEVRIDSILFDEEQDASAARARIEAGEEFAALAGEMAGSGADKAHDSERFFKMEELLPVVRRAVSGLAVGEASSVLQVGDRFAVIKLLEFRYPDDPAARRETEQAVLKQDRTNALRGYTESLIERYTTVDEELLRSLDYSKDGPGLESMLADERVVAEVEGGEPVTVAELTRSLEKKAFHGAERAIERGKFEQRKHPTLEGLLKNRAIDLEAQRQKIAQTQRYRTMVEEQRKSVLFGLFLERAIESSIKIDPKELEAYRLEHLDEYSTPEMLRIDALAFVERDDAAAAVEKLRNGADFQWMRANAAGQVTAEDDSDLLRFDGRMPIVTNGLPDEVRKAVAGVQAGDARFCAAPEGPFYVLLVRDVIAGRPQEFEAVKATLAKRVFGEKRQAAFDEWIAALRAASEIEIFATGDALLEALGLDVASHD